MDDLRSKFLVENSVLKMEYLETRVLFLGSQDLTSLCHLEQLLLVTHLDLSHNRLRSLPPALAALRCLEVLQANDNVIETLDGVTNLPRLQEFVVSNNRLQQPAVLQPLSSCPRLALLNLQGNPLCQAAGALECLAELLPSVSNILT